MKCNYSVISIILCIVIFFSACGITGTENGTSHTKVDQVSGNLNNNNNNLSNGGSGTPGLSTSFHTIEELEAMISASKLTDSALADFLHTHAYDEFGQGIYNRDTLELFLQPFRLLGFPYVEATEAVTSFGGSFRPRELRWHFAYRTGGVRYRFQYTVYDEKYDFSGLTPVGNYQIGEVSFKLYEATSGDGLVSTVYFDIFALQITVTEYESVEDVTFEQFSWRKVQ